jgi:hypothetical protein
MSAAIMLHLMAALFLIGSLSSGQAAEISESQPPADFSGTWTLEAPPVATTPAVPGTPAAAAAPGDMGSGWGSTITIAQDASRLRVEYPFFSRYDAQPPLIFAYPLDGSEGRNVISMGRGDQIETARARWDGSTLIITTTSQVSARRAANPFTVEVTRKLALASPTMLVVEVTRAGVLGGASTTTRSVYRKS